MSSIRKSFWPTETDLFQELQKDPLIRKRFEERLKWEADGGLEMGNKEQELKEQREREGEIQELLERRRVLLSDDGNGEVVRSPVEVEDLRSGVVRSPSGGNLVRRKFSVERRSVGFEDREEFEMGSRMTTRPGPKTRHSVDIAEVLGRR